MKATDFMTKDVITCNDNQTVSEAAKLMSEKGFSVMPIVDNSGALTGIVTESDFVGKEVQIPHALVSLKRTLGEDHYHGDIESIYDKAKNRKLCEVMTQKPITVDEDASLNSIVNLMLVKNIKRLPVIKEGKIVGIITRKDIIKAFVKLT